MRTFFILMLAAITLAACGPSRSERIAAANRRPPATATPPGWSPAVAYPVSGLSPRIVTPRRRLQCVPYTRELSGIQIRGDAWTWWNTAAGKYARSHTPVVGAVLVLRKTSRNRYGHLAVVTRILNDREIVVSHANWLNKGRIHIDTPVRDESARGDWSSVRFWYTPGKVYGRSLYAANGFILPSRQAAR